MLHMRRKINFFSDKKAHPGPWCIYGFIHPTGNKLSISVALNFMQEYNAYIL